jgi:O-antigen ligase
MLVVAFAIWIVAAGGAEHLVERRPEWFWPALALCAWAALQLVPLPPGALRAVSGGASARLESGLPGYGSPAGQTLLQATRASAAERVPAQLPAAPPAVSGAVDVSSSITAPRWHPVSIAPSMTAECLGWYVALLAGALTLWGFLESERARRAAKYAVFTAFVAVALAGAYQLAGDGAPILWFHPVAGAAPIGPYVNPRHFAGAMEMAVPWMAACAAGLWMDGRHESSRRAGGVAIAALAAIAFVAGLGGQSRLAAVTMSLGLSVLALTAVRPGRRLRVLAGLGAAWAAGAAVILATPLGERFRVFVSTGLGGTGGSDRAVIWKAMLPAIGRFWLTGSGYGSFRWLAPPYIPAGDGGRWLQLHSDWLESALTGGAIGFALLLALAATVAIAATSRLRAVSSRAARIEQIGLLIGLGSLAVHAAVDFNHQIPANALLFVVLGVFATSQVRASREGIRR